MRRRLIAVLVVLCGVLAATASGGARESTPVAPEPIAEGRTEGPEEALRRDAHEIAKMRDISDEEALRRLELQLDVIPAFAQHVRRRERHRLGGFYIQHEPEYRVVVLLTSGDLSDVEGYVPDRLRGLVVVRRVERTQRELHAMNRRVGRLRSVVSFDSWSNVVENRVEVSFIAPSAADVESTTRTIREAAELSGGPLPDWVAITGSVVPVEQTSGETAEGLLTRVPIGSGMEMSALPSGVLEMDSEHGCVLLSGRAVVWPAGTTLTWDPAQVHLAGGLTARPGDTVRGGGASVPGYWAREMPTGIEADVEKALDCAPETDVVFFTSRGEAMSVFRG